MGKDSGIGNPYWTKYRDTSRNSKYVCINVISLAEVMSLLSIDKAKIHKKFMKYSTK